MKTFPTLYKRTKTGTIQYWKIETRDSDIAEASQIRTESGQLGTANPTEHLEAIYIGKQKRSREEQAVFQAESDWKKKRDEGYKSLKDLITVTDSVTNEDKTDEEIPQLENERGTDWQRILKILKSF